MKNLTPHTRQITMVSLSLLMAYSLYKGEMNFAGDILLFLGIIFQVKGE